MFENGSKNFKFSFTFKSDHFHVSGAFEKNSVYQRFYTLGCHRRRKNSVTGKRIQIWQLILYFKH